MSNRDMIKADTFTCSYSEQEDRLLLTINYQDITKRVDFWITRAFLIKLLPYFFEYKGESSEVRVSSDEDSKNHNITPTDNSTFTLTSKEPMLLDSIDFRAVEGGMRVVFKNREKGVNVLGTFDKSLLTNVISLITNAVPSYGWGISQDI